MKLGIKVMIGIVGVTLLVVPGMAAAQTTPATPPPGSSFAHRLELRKKERNIQLDTKTQMRLVEQCITAQTNIRAIQQRLTPIFTDRTKLYQQIDGKLWIAIGQLKLAHKDTFELEKRRSTLAEKTVALQSLAANFQQTLDDMVVINCKSDLVGFKALLETARLYLTQLRQQTTELRSYVIDAIKPELATHVSSLQPKTTEEGGQ